MIHMPSENSNAGGIAEVNALDLASSNQEAHWMEARSELEIVQGPSK